MRSRAMRFVLAGVLVLAVVIVGGLVTIHLVEGGSKAKLALPTVTTTVAPAGSTASNGPVVVDGVWNIASGSTAGYRIQENLFGVSNTAVGRTSAVTGSFTISGTTVTAGNFSVDLTKVTSDRSERDGQFQGRIMDTADFPTATFKLTSPIDLTTLPLNGVQLTKSATGDLMLHGVTKSVTFTLTAQRNGSQIQVAGSVPITFSDYNIANPSGGPATTGNTGSMEFLLNFTHA
jgi:polyisoprenoid-binding protein YceI